MITDVMIMSRRPYSSGAKAVNKRIGEILTSLIPDPSDKNTEKGLRNTIYKLKKDGLIDYEETNRGRKILITQKGKDFITRSKESLLPPRRYFSVESQKSDKGLKIIIFDIPESERRKRNWLRSAIKNLGFNQLQQSVWAGNASIPELFLVDIKELNLLNFVEIFSVNKKGTIQKHPLNRLTKPA